jgi:hypothetical protein
MPLMPWLYSSATFSRIVSQFTHPLDSGISIDRSFCELIPQIYNQDVGIASLIAFFD